MFYSYQSICRWWCRCDWTVSSGWRKDQYTMIALMRLLRSNKQVLELFCLIVSVPLVWINVELHLSQLYPRHSSVAAALHYRRVRELSFDKESFSQNLFS